MQRSTIESVPLPKSYQAVYPTLPLAYLFLQFTSNGTDRDRLSDRSGIKGEKPISLVGLKRTTSCQVILGFSSGSLFLNRTITVQWWIYVKEMN